jgi:hypothetical protein
MAANARVRIWWVRATLFRQPAGDDAVSGQISTEVPILERDHGRTAGVAAGQSTYPAEVAQSSSRSTGHVLTMRSTGTPASSAR